MGFRILALGDVDPRTREDLARLDRGTEILDHPGGDDLRLSIESLRPHLVVIGSGVPGPATVTLDRDDCLVPVIASEDRPRADLILPEEHSSRQRTLRSARRLASLCRAHRLASESSGARSEHEPSPETFFEQLEREFTRGIRHRHPLSLLTVTPDRMEAMAGGPGGDVVREFVSTLFSALRRSVRGMDLPFRIGVDEIALLLPETPPEGACVVAERANAQARRLMLKPAGRALPVKTTASIGIVGSPCAGIETSLGVLEAAREAMARAREDGGDRFVVHQGC